MEMGHNGEFSDAPRIVVVGVGGGGRDRKSVV